MVEKMYGVGIFYEDAANALIPEAYSKAVDETDWTSYPSLPSMWYSWKAENRSCLREVAVKPEVTLWEYKGLEVPKARTGKFPRRILQQS